jgi:antitoxin ParD1/3/4
MNVNLTPQLESMVRQKVETGLYNNASEVVREALRLMEERDRFRRLQVAISRAQAQHARGEATTWTDETLAELIREADEADRLGLPISDDVQP